MQWFRGWATVPWLVPLLLAQEPASPRVLGHGSGLPGPERCRVARNAAEWAAIEREEALPAGLLQPDFARELLVVLWYGGGRGGAPSLSVLRSAPERPNRLLRLAGEVGARRVEGRWAVLGLPTAWEPWRTTTWFETDGPMVGGAPSWRTVLPARSPFALAALGEVEADAGADVLWFTDAVAFRTFWREKAPTPIPDHDFSQRSILVVAGRPESLYTMMGAEQAGADVQPWLLARRRQPDPEARASPPTFRCFCLPRWDGVLDYEVPVPGEPGTVKVAARLRVDPAAVAPRLRVWRLLEAELPAQRDTWCERATTAAEWRALRARLGGAGAELASDFADFAHDCIVVVATDEAPVSPGVGLRVDEEEGVDVLTIVQPGAAGRDPGSRSRAVVVKLPRRKGQLAVVLQRAAGPAPGTERTLRVFPGS